LASDVLAPNNAAAANVWLILGFMGHTKPGWVGGHLIQWMFCGAGQLHVIQSL
jgi:hypothetical protein